MGKANISSVAAFHRVVDSPAHHQLAGRTVLPLVAHRLLSRLVGDDARMAVFARSTHKRVNTPLPLLSALEFEKNIDV